MQEPPNINTNIQLSLRGGMGTEWGLGNELIEQLDNRHQTLRLEIDVPDSVMQLEIVDVTATGMTIMEYKKYRK